MKTLNLKKETLRQLDPDVLQQTRGGTLQGSLGPSLVPGPQPTVTGVSIWSTID